MSEAARRQLEPLLPELLRRRLRQPSRWTRELASPSVERYDGALVFVDISGFSRLSEQLSKRHGNEGAELLQTYINRYFSALIRVVVSHGGDLLKFAGDAFIAAWRADDDAGMPPGFGSVCSVDDGVSDVTRHVAELTVHSNTSATSSGFSNATLGTGEKVLDSSHRLAATVIRAWQCCAQLLLEFDGFVVAEEGIPLRLHAGISAGKIDAFTLGAEPPEGDGYDYFVAGAVVASMGDAAGAAASGEIVLSSQGVASMGGFSALAALPLPYRARGDLPDHANLPAANEGAAAASAVFAVPLKDYATPEEEELRRSALSSICEAAAQALDQAALVHQRLGSLASAVVPGAGLYQTEEVEGGTLAYCERMGMWVPSVIRRVVEQASREPNTMNLSPNRSTGDESTLRGLGLDSRFASGRASSPSLRYTGERGASSRWSGDESYDSPQPLHADQAGPSDTHEGGFTATASVVGVAPPLPCAPDIASSEQGDVGYSPREDSETRDSLTPLPSTLAIGLGILQTPDSLRAAGLGSAHSLRGHTGGASLSPVSVPSYSTVCDSPSSAGSSPVRMCPARSVHDGAPVSSDTFVFRPLAGGGDSEILRTPHTSMPGQSACTTVDQQTYWGCRLGESLDRSFGLAHSLSRSNSNLGGERTRYLRLRNSLLTAEHRIVSCAFLQLGGLGSGLCDIADPEKAQAALLCVQRMAMAHHAALVRTIVDDKGVRCLLACGLPGFAADDDAYRATTLCLHCAHELSRMLRLHVHCGITSGRMYCGEAGSELRAEYTLHGKRVNAAARMMSHAAKIRAVLVVDDATRDAAMRSHPGAIMFEASTPFVAKGFDQPLATFVCRLPLLVRQSTAELRAEQFALGSSGVYRIIMGSGDDSDGSARRPALTVKTNAAFEAAMMAGASASGDYATHTDDSDGSFSVASSPLHHSLASSLGLNRNSEANYYDGDTNSVRSECSSPSPVHTAAIRASARSGGDGGRWAQRRPSLLNSRREFSGDVVNSHMDARNAAARCDGNVDIIAPSRAASAWPATASPILSEPVNAPEVTAAGAESPLAAANRPATMGWETAADSYALTTLSAPSPAFISFDCGTMGGLDEQPCGCRDVQVPACISLPTFKSHEAVEPDADPRWLSLDARVGAHSPPLRPACRSAEGDEGTEQQSGLLGQRCFGTRRVYGVQSTDLTDVLVHQSLRVDNERNTCREGTTDDLIDASVAEPINSQARSPRRRSSGGSGRSLSCSRRNSFRRRSSGDQDAAADAECTAEAGRRGRRPPRHGAATAKAPRRCPGSDSDENGAYSSSACASVGVEQRARSSVAGKRFSVAPGEPEESEAQHADRNFTVAAARGSDAGLGMRSTWGRSLGGEPSSTGKRSSRRRSVAMPQVLLGRESEIIAIEDAVSSLAAGIRGGLILVEGEAGLGKTAILQHAAATAAARGLSVVVTTARGASAIGSGSVSTTMGGLANGPPSAGRRSIDGRFSRVGSDGALSEYLKRRSLTCAMAPLGGSAQAPSRYSNGCYGSGSTRTSYSSGGAVFSGPFDVWVALLPQLLPRAYLETLVDQYLAFLPEEGAHEECQTSCSAASTECHELSAVPARAAVDGASSLDEYRTGLLPPLQSDGQCSSGQESTPGCRTPHNGSPSLNLPVATLRQQARLEIVTPSEVLRDVLSEKREGHHCEAHPPVMVVGSVEPSEPSAPAHAQGAGGPQLPQVPPSATRRRPGRTAGCAWGLCYPSDSPAASMSMPTTTLHGSSPLRRGQMPSCAGRPGSPPDLAVDAVEEPQTFALPPRIEDMAGARDKHGSQRVYGVSCGVSTSGADTVSPAFGCMSRVSCKCYVSDSASAGAAPADTPVQSLSSEPQSRQRPLTCSELQSSLSFARGSHKRHRGFRHLGVSEIALLSDADARDSLPLLNSVLPLELPESSKTMAMAPDERADATQALLVRLVHERLQVRGPVLLLIDDAHRMHPSSWNLLASLLESSGQKMLVILARNPQMTHSDLLPAIAKLLMPPENDTTDENSHFVSSHVVETAGPTQKLTPLGTYGAVHSPPTGAFAPSEGPRSDTRLRLVLRLGPLAEADEEALLKRWLRVSELPAALLPAVRAKSGGNPYFAQELVFGLLHSGQLVLVDEEMQPQTPNAARRSSRRPFPSPNSARASQGDQRSGSPCTPMAAASGTRHVGSSPEPALESSGCERGGTPPSCRRAGDCSPGAPPPTVRRVARLNIKRQSHAPAPRADALGTPPLRPRSTSLASQPEHSRERGDCGEDESPSAPARSRRNSPLSASAPVAATGYGGDAANARGPVLVLDLPDSVHAMVMARVDALSPDALLTLKVASVIGHSFSLATLAAIHPLSAGIFNSGSGGGMSAGCKSSHRSSAADGTGSARSIDRFASILNRMRQTCDQLVGHSLLRPCALYAADDGGSASGFVSGRSSNSEASGAGGLGAACGANGPSATVSGRTSRALVASSGEVAEKHDYVFVSQLVREGVYNMLPFAQRARLHGAVAATLERELVKRDAADLSKRRRLGLCTYENAVALDKLGTHWRAARKFGRAQAYTQRAAQCAAMLHELNWAASLLEVAMAIAEERDAALASGGRGSTGEGRSACELRASTESRSSQGESEQAHCSTGEERTSGVSIASDGAAAALSPPLSATSQSVSQLPNSQPVERLLSIDELAKEIITLRRMEAWELAEVATDKDGQRSPSSLFIKRTSTPLLINKPSEHDGLAHPFAAELVESDRHTT